MVKAYKGFNKDMTCKGFQYEEGTIYKMDKTPELCNVGFHACLLPLDCLRYYRPDESVYHEVELFGEIVGVNESNDTDSKICASMIKIGRELTLREMTDIHIGIIYKKQLEVPENRLGIKDDASYIAMNEGSHQHVVSLFDRCIAVTKGEATTSAASGNYSIAVSKSDTHNISISQGNDSASIAHGDFSESIVRGINSIAVNSGHRGLAMALGDGSISVSKGDESKSITNQNGSTAVSTKSHSISKTKGSSSMAISNSPQNGKAFTEASFSIAAVNGYCSKSKCQASHSIAVARGAISTSLTEDTNSISVAEDQYSKSVATADNSVSVSNGCESISTSAGDFSASVAIGEAPSSFVHGKCSISSAVGELSSAAISNKNSVAISLGKMSKCKGVIGSYIVLTELDDNNEIICVKVVYIDGNKYKPDVWYTLKNKKVVEFDGTLPTIECIQQYVTIDESIEYTRCKPTLKGFKQQ